jgi:hypothetical protein
MVLATAAAGAALCAGPVHADESQPDVTAEQVAAADRTNAANQAFPSRKQEAAPLRSILNRANLFRQAKDEPMAKGEGKGEGKEEGKDEGGGGACPWNFQNQSVFLFDNPVAYTLPCGFGGDFVRNHPAGFPADWFQYYAFGVGLGGGTDLNLSAVRSEALGTPGSAMFWGAGIKKRLIKEDETGFMPEVALGIRGNVGPHSHKTGAAYLVGTKKLYGQECGPAGIWLTGGIKAEGYDSDQALFRQRRALHVLLDQSGAGVRTFGGLNIGVTKWLRFAGEVDYPEPWEFNTPFVLRASLTPYQGWGITGGVRNVGYVNHGFVGLEIGDLSSLFNTVFQR